MWYPVFIFCTYEASQFEFYVLIVSLKSLSTVQKFTPMDVAWVVQSNINMWDPSVSLNRQSNVQRICAQINNKQCFHVIKKFISNDAWRLLYERNLEYNNKVCACYVDYEKAFERVDWTKLMTILQNRSRLERQ